MDHYSLTLEAILVTICQRSLTLEAILGTICWRSLPKVDIYTNRKEIPLYTLNPLERKRAHKILAGQNTTEGTDTVWNALTIIDEQ